MLEEFSLISRYFNRLKVYHPDVEMGIGDDCAILRVSEDRMLAISIDTMVCGNHFLPNIDPADLAYKALAVNVSDFAAIGAKPSWLTLSLTLPEVNEIWLKSFSDMLFNQLSYYDMQLIGGDTTSGPLSITMTIHGLISNGCAIKRSGAKPGDWIYVTGTLGDSAAGLAILQNRLTVKNADDVSFFLKRHLRPIPRILHGQALCKYASSAIDLSDGLISDINHILKASKVGARINLDALPLSVSMKRNIEIEQALHWALSGGEDYELFFTIPKSHLNMLDLALNDLGVPFTHIGQLLPENEGLQFVQDGIPIMLNYKGYDHFV